MRRAIGAGLERRLEPVLNEALPIDWIELLLLADETHDTP
jgi:hypothetical protein